MTLVFSTDGYFCEGEIDKDWKFRMKSGKILLTDTDLSLIKKSNISLTEVGTPVDDFKDGYVIPLTQILKSYSTKIQKIYVVKVDTRDGHLFSLTTANDRNIGKDGSFYLSEMINSTTLLANNAKNLSSPKTNTESEFSPNICSNCGENYDSNWIFCKKCGKAL